jgi:dihydropteroate synthase
MPLVLLALEERASAAVDAGVARDSIVLDPGFGFGKAFDENYPLLAQLDRLHTLGFPVLAGVSRKSFLRHKRAGGEDGAGVGPAGTGVKSEVRLTTEVANTAAILGGAHILRVHDVGPARETAAIADRVLEVADA